MLHGYTIQQCMPNSLIGGIQFLVTGSAWFVKDMVDKFFEHSGNFIDCDIRTCDREHESWGLYFG